MNIRSFVSALASVLLGATSALADENERPLAAEHAPIGVMGDHGHTKGELMMSYRFMRMDMEGNRIGGSEVDALEIVNSVPNIFNANVNPEKGRPMQPPTLRVVPTDMRMDMHMLGAMYGVSNRLTIMAMGSYVTKEMDHVTYSGAVPAGEITEDDQIGEFTTQAEGFGDTRVSALVNLPEVGKTKALLQVGVSIPTGAIDEEDAVLAPNGAEPTLRLPYPMQLGSGTYDPFLSYTITGREGRFGYGVQGSGLWRFGDNNEDYSLGDEYRGTFWASWSFVDWLSASGRVAYESRKDITGIDDEIVAPVQTANPDFQGGDRVDLGLGVNAVMPAGPAQGVRLAAEVLMPVYQNLNGPQLETDAVYTLGLQYTWH